MSDLPQYETVLHTTNRRFRLGADRLIPGIDISVEPHTALSSVCLSSSNFLTAGRLVTPLVSAHISTSTLTSFVKQLLNVSELPCPSTIQTSYMPFPPRSHLGVLLWLTSHYSLHSYSSCDATSTFLPIDLLLCRTEIFVLRHLRGEHDLPLILAFLVKCGWNRCGEGPCGPRLDVGKGDSRLSRLTDSSRSLEVPPTPPVTWVISDFPP